MDVVRGNKDIEDLHDFENKNNVEKRKKKEAEDEARKNKNIKGLLEQCGTLLYKRSHGFSVSKFEKLIPYVKNYEREQMDIPQKHFFIGHHEYDSLTSRVDRLNAYAVE